MGSGLIVLLQQIIILAFWKIIFIDFSEVTDYNKKRLKGFALH
jgi:hypothetical protein